tara:strand:+ start:325 stop:468 length:144 start_codon:yes stop_codon:yes gene_type:complete
MLLKEQIENLSKSKFDPQMWRHFQQLLKKNLHNPYLREALLKKSQNM